MPVRSDSWVRVGDVVSIHSRFSLQYVLRLTPYAYAIYDLEHAGAAGSDMVSFHIKDRKAPVPRVIRNLGSSSPPFDHLPTGPSNRVDTVHSLECLPEYRYTPS